MRILLTGGTDKFGHPIVFLFLKNVSSEIDASSDGDRSFFHNQLRHCLNILIPSPSSSGISLLADMRNASTIEQLNAVISSLVICNNELSAKIEICYFIEPSARHIRRALGRFLKCDESVEKAAFKLPFQVLLFSSCKSLKDYINVSMLPEELGGNLMWDEVTYLLQLAVIDSICKLKASLSAMNSFVESISSGDIVDGDISSCLEQYTTLREQAFGLYSHLKSSKLDRFDPFVTFRKLFSEGDSLHSIATQLRAVLMERQYRLNAFSTLCSKLGDAEHILQCLDNILSKPDINPDHFKGITVDRTDLSFEQIFDCNSGSSVMSQLLNDVRYLIGVSQCIQDDQLRSQLKSAYDLDALTRQADRIEVLYADAAEYMKKQLGKVAAGRIAETDPLTSVHLEVNCESSNSPCPLSSSSMSHATSDNSKTTIATPSFSDISPVDSGARPQVKSEVEGESTRLTESDVSSKTGIPMVYPVIRPVSLIKFPDSTAHSSMLNSLNTLNDFALRLEKAASLVSCPQSIPKQSVAEIRTCIDLLSRKARKIRSDVASSNTVLV